MKRVLTLGAGLFVLFVVPNDPLPKIGWRRVATFPRPDLDGMPRESMTPEEQRYMDVALSHSPDDDDTILSFVHHQAIDALIRGLHQLKAMHGLPRRKPYAWVYETHDRNAGPITDIEFTETCPPGWLGKSDVFPLYREE